MSLGSFLKRAVRKVGKVVKKAAPLAAVAGLGFALGPAGAGVGARILGGLGRAAKGAVKVARRAQPLLQGMGLPGGGLPLPTGGATPPFIPDQHLNAGSIVGRVMTGGGRSVVKDVARRATAPIAPQATKFPLGMISTTATPKATVVPSPVATGPTPAAPPKPSNVDTGVRFRQALPAELTPGAPGVIDVSKSITSAGVAQMSLVSIAGKLAQRIPQILRNPTIQGTIGGLAGGAIAGLPALTGPTNGNGEKKKYRRMNYGNAKAARRAIRRIKGVRKMLQDIERQLPRKQVRARAQKDLGAGHTHVR